MMSKIEILTNIEKIICRFPLTLTSYDLIRKKISWVSALISSISHSTYQYNILDLDSFMRT